MLLHSLVPLLHPAVTVALVHVAHSYLMVPSLSRALGPFDGNIPVLQCTHLMGSPNCPPPPANAYAILCPWECGTPVHSYYTPRYNLQSTIKLNSS